MTNANSTQTPSVQISVDLRFDLHDYIATSPQLPSDSEATGLRGGDVSVLDEEQRALLLRDSLAFIGLIRGADEARPLRTGDFSHAVHQNIAYERGVDNYRDSLVHALGMAANIDVDGGLALTERQAKIKLHPNDQTKLGIISIDENKDVEATVSSLPFSYLPTRSSWRINEFVIPGIALSRDEALPVGTLMRILSVTPFRNPTK